MFHGSICRLELFFFVGIFHQSNEYTHLFFLRGVPTETNLVSQLNVLRAPHQVFIVNTLHIQAHAQGSDFGGLNPPLPKLHILGAPPDFP